MRGASSRFLPSGAPHPAPAAPPSPRAAGRGTCEQLHFTRMIRVRNEHGVTTITLDRPEKLNAFSGTMREDLLAALREAAGDVVVITGAGRAFCAGGDVELMASLQETNDVARFGK